MPRMSRAEMAAYTRRTIIDTVKRRQRPGTGSLLRRGDAPLRKWPDFSELLAGIPWAVAGGVATRHYMPERATQDIDVVVETARLNEAEQRFRDAGFDKTGPLAIGGSAWRAPDGTVVDLIEGRASWWTEALEAAAANRDQQGLPVLTLPYLVLMKAIASRAPDVSDITQMLGDASGGALSAVRDVMRRHYRDYVEDLESLIVSGRMMYHPEEFEAAGEELSEDSQDLTPGPP